MKKVSKKPIVKAIVVISVILLCGIFMFSCTSKKVDEKAEVYKVGAVFSVTGRASFLGDPEKKTAELIVEKINADGGINGHKLELIVYDTEGDATKCNLAVNLLVEIQWLLYQLLKKRKHPWYHVLPATKLFLMKKQENHINGYLKLPSQIPWLLRQFTRI